MSMPIKKLAIDDKWDNKRCSLWEKIDDLRYELVRKLPWSWREKYYTVRDFFFPRQRWLTKAIPNGWCDKDRIIETVLFECVKHFVSEDGEDALNILCNDNPPDQKRFIEELKAMYQFITVKLPELEKELEKAWDKVPHRSLSDLNKSTKESYEQTYGEVNRLEKEIEELKTLICEWVVKNREAIWT